MTEDRVKRKLSAILSADVEGYSRLMGEDEVSTVRTLESYRKVMADLIDHFRGRVVDSPGDNLLAEFSSVVDAVQCAVEIHEVLRAKNQELPEERRMLFRIGVNLGDVIEEGDRIYGDGVNIAARLESLADAGGICISGSAYEQIENKLALGYEYLGEHTVKNIAKTVKVYRVPMGPKAVTPKDGKEKKAKLKKWQWAALCAVVALILVIGTVAIWNFYLRRPSVEAADPEKMAYALPDKPSIAVLPFDDLSDDPEHEYLTDGITENIIMALSKMPDMFVIARNSTFTYKGKPIKAQQVAEELGVRYVLEGSVQRSGDRLRITAQLIDAIEGHHIWAERYDRELTDIFALQDEITLKIITPMRVKLTGGEGARVHGIGTDNLDAYLKYMQGYKHFRRFNPDDFILARRYFKEAIALDPEFANPYAFMGTMHLVEFRQGLSKSPQKSIEQAFKLAQKALALDESLPNGHTLLGQIHLIKGQHEKAIAASERAVALAPNNLGSLNWLGKALSSVGRHQEAIPHFERAIRLNPLNPTVNLTGLGETYNRMERYEEAITVLKKAIHYQPDFLIPHLNLAACYAALGREEEAHAEAAEVLRLNPKFSVKKFVKRSSIRDKAEKDRFIDALRKAGLPYKPPLPLPDKPSIAVLPFTNMSGDPEQEYFNDGLTEEIINGLSKVPRLFVIARNSTFTYKGKPVKVQQVSKELGVRYVLEGSVREAGDRVRITAQLIDATTGHHLWSERYDRELRDIFELQDEITKKILIALQVKLTHGETARVFAKSTHNFEAYLKYLQALELIWQPTRVGFVRARQLLEEAILLDPKYSEAYRQLGNIHYRGVNYGWSKSPRDSIETARKMTQKAITLDESNAAAYGTLGQILVTKREYDEAIAAAERGYELEPNSPPVLALYAIVLNWVGRTQEAVQLWEEVMRLAPIPPNVALRGYAGSLINAERYDEAITLLERAIEQASNVIGNHILLTQCYWLSARKEEARSEAAEVLRLNPKFSIEKWLRRNPAKDRAKLKIYSDAMREAGLPD